MEAEPLTVAALLSMPPADYMNPAQLAFFKGRLLALRQQTSAHIETIKHEISQIQLGEADELDRAHAEEDNRQSMRIAEREYYLLRKIDKALKRIEEGSYGFCEVSGQEIGLQRLLVRPTAELCTEEKARQEQLERNFSKNRK